MDQRATEPGLQGDARSLENSLKALWDRVRKASEVIAQLREDKRVLTSRVAELESQVRHVQAELARKTQAEAAGDSQGAGARRGSGALDNGEREALAGRLKDLLAKLDSYL